MPLWCHVGRQAAVVASGDSRVVSKATVIVEAQRGDADETYRGGQAPQARAVSAAAKCA